MDESERKKLEQAITHLEAQRAVLGDDVVEVALAPLRQRLATLKAQESGVHQRKQVSVLFADLSGFTAMSEGMDAEDLSEMMNALWHRLDAVITTHGGRIDKHFGDGVMALWGAEAAREDDPEQAIRAALEMQAEVARFRAPERGGEERLERPKVALRVGVHTGLVIVGEVATTHEFTAIGDTVNLASRLEQAAPVGGVLISHDTYQHVRGLFEAEPQELLQVKGKAEPVQTHLVQRARPRSFHASARGVEGIQTRMVGRDAELQTLQKAFHLTMQTAQTRLVTVVGEAGVGKSRLLFEFEHWIDRLPSQITRLKGRAYPETTNTPFSVFRDLFRERFKILDSDSAAVVRDKFEIGMSPHLDGGQAYLVGQLVGFDFSATTAVQNLLNSPSFGSLALAYLTSYLQSVTAREPTLILLEDLHWTDNASLDLIAHLGRELCERRLLIVCLTRRVLYERRPEWDEIRTSERAPVYIRLDLKPLSPGDSRTLVGEILQRVEQLPDDLCELVANSAEGNPFYVEELIKMLIEDGVITRGDERWRVDMEQLKQARVPATLTGVLQARLDSLPRGEKVLLQRASVVGRLFWDATVAYMHAEDEALDYQESTHILPALNAIQGRELVFQRKQSAFAGTREYIFKHAILRDVTYETVLLKLRRAYHKQVAQWLEVHSGERLNEYAGPIADHYERAGENAQAVKWLQRVGQVAFRTSSFLEAITAFERAMALLSDEDQATRAALQIGIGSAYESTGDYPVAVDHLREGLALARQVGEAQSMAKALSLLGSISIWRGEYDEAHALIEEALPHAANDPLSHAEALRQMGNVYYSYGDNQAAAGYYEESLGLSREAGDRYGITSALNNLGLVSMLAGDYKAAMHYYEDCLGMDREAGDRRGVAIGLLNLGVAALWQGDPSAAKPYLEESLALCQETKNREGAATCCNVLGHIARQLGEMSAAERYYRQALVDVNAIGAVPRVLDTLAGIAGLRLAQGERQQAAELLGLALGHPASDSNVMIDAEPIMTELRAALAADELEAAMKRGRQLDLGQVVAEILAAPDG